MSEGPRCPPPDTLMQLTSGQLSDPEAASVRRHVVACSVCTQTVEMLTSSTKALSRERAPADEPPDVTQDAPADLAAFLAPPQRDDELGRLGSYRILDVLGEGGMGVVFLAEDATLERKIALKVMKPEDAANLKSRQRFLQEGKLAASLQHDHIVTIYQVGEDRGMPFLAMQFLIGESLDDRLKRGESLSVPEIIRIGREVAEGLGAAHERGLIHRDIKPANIWLETRGQESGVRSQESGVRGQESDVTPGFRVKILDFGLARMVGDKQTHLTRTGMIMGTPDYMAPEQARGLELDHRCDLFSLGCVLYQACTGQKPFRADDVMATLVALTSEEPIPIRQINPNIPWELEERVKALMSKHPGDRPKNARAVVDELAYVEKVLAEGGSRAPTMPERERNYVPASRRKFRKPEATPTRPPAATTPAAPPETAARAVPAETKPAPRPLEQFGLMATQTTAPVEVEEPVSSSQRGPSAPPPSARSASLGTAATAPAPVPRIVPVPTMPGSGVKTCARCGTNRFSSLGWCLNCGHIPGQPLDAGTPRASGGSPGLTWALVTLGGGAGIVALTVLANARFIRGTLEWNHWAWYQLVSGLTVVAMAYLWSYLLVWPYHDNSRTALPLFSSPIMLFKLTLRMFYKTRNAVSFGTWGVTAAVAVFIVVGDPTFWLKGNRMNLAPPRYRFALAKSTAKDMKFSQRCVIIGYVLEGGEVAELVLAEQDGGRLVYAGRCTRTDEAANNDGVTDRLGRLTRREPVISGLNLSAQWVDPKVSCNVLCDQRDAKGIMIDPVIVSWEK